MNLILFRRVLLLGIGIPMGLFLALALGGSAMGSSALGGAALGSSALGGAVFQVANKPITMREELITMEEFGQKLQAASGVNIEIPRPFRERKLDIFVDDLPLNRVLKGVGDALRGYWQKTDTGYRFEIETQQRTIEEKLRVAELNDLSMKAKAYFAACNILAEWGPQNVTFERIRDWTTDKVRRLEGREEEEDLVVATSDLLREAAQENSPRTKLALAFGSCLSEKERNRLLNGEIFYIASGAQNVAETSPLWKQLIGEGSGKAYLAILKGPVVKGKGCGFTIFTCESSLLGENKSLRRFSSSPFGPYEYRVPPEGLSGTFYEDRLKQWLPLESLQEPLKRKLTNLKSKQEGPFRGGAFRPGNLFRILKESADINVIAEGNRVRISQHPLQPAPNTAYDLLSRWLEPAFGFFQFDDRLLIVRDPAHWKNILEPSEARLRNAERLAKERRLNLRGWIEIAQLFSREEFYGLGQLATNLPQREPELTWDSLRFLGSLSQAQLSGKEVSVNDLSSAQKELLGYLVLTFIATQPFRVVLEEGGIHDQIAAGALAPLGALTNSKAQGANSPTLKFAVRTVNRQVLAKGKSAYEVDNGPTEDLFTNGFATELFVGTRQDRGLTLTLFTEPRANSSKLSR